MGYSGSQTTHIKIVPWPPAGQSREGASWCSSLSTSRLCFTTRSTVNLNSVPTMVQAGAGEVQHLGGLAQPGKQIWGAHARGGSDQAVPAGPDLLRPEEALSGAGGRPGSHWAGEARLHCSLPKGAAARGLLGPRWKGFCVLFCLCCLPELRRLSVLHNETTKLQKSVSDHKHSEGSMGERGQLIGQQAFQSAAWHVQHALLPIYSSTAETVWIPFAVSFAAGGRGG